MYKDKRNLSFYYRECAQQCALDNLYLPVPTKTYNQQARLYKVVHY